MSNVNNRITGALNQIVDYDANTGLITSLRTDLLDTIDLGNISNVSITGGNSGDIMATDGNGQLSWVSPVAGTNGQILFNNNGALGAIPSTSYNGNVTTLGNVAQISITGGNSGQALYTDGSGVLTWRNVTATAGGPNTSIQYNDTGTLVGSSELVFENGNTLTVGSATGTQLSVITQATDVAAGTRIVNTPNGSNVDTFLEYSVNDLFAKHSFTAVNYNDSNAFSILPASPNVPHVTLGAVGTAASSVANASRDIRVVSTGTAFTASYDSVTGNIQDNAIKITPADVGNTPTIAAVGADADIGMTYQVQGNAAHTFAGNVFMNTLKFDTSDVSSSATYYIKPTQVATGGGTAIRLSAGDGPANIGGTPGSLFLSGGTGAVTVNGGDVVISGGDTTGSGRKGRIIIGNNTTDTVLIRTSNVSSGFAGTISMDAGAGNNFSFNGNINIGSVLKTTSAINIGFSDTANTGLRTSTVVRGRLNLPQYNESYSDQATSGGDIYYNTTEGQLYSFNERSDQWQRTAGLMQARYSIAQVINAYTATTVSNVALSGPNTLPNGISISSGTFYNNTSATYYATVNWNAEFGALVGGQRQGVLIVKSNGVTGLKLAGSDQPYCTATNKVVVGGTVTFMFKPGDNFSLNVYGDPVNNSQMILGNVAGIGGTVFDSYINLVLH